MMMVMVVIVIVEVIVVVMLEWLTPKWLLPLDSPMIHTFTSPVVISSCIMQACHSSSCRHSSPWPLLFSLCLPLPSSVFPSLGDSPPSQRASQPASQPSELMPKSQATSSNCSYPQQPVNYQVLMLWPLNHVLKPTVFCLSCSCFTWDHITFPLTMGIPSWQNCELRLAFLQATLHLTIRGNLPTGRSGHAILTSNPISDLQVQGGP